MYEDRDWRENGAAWLERWRDHFGRKAGDTAGTPQFQEYLSLAGRYDMMARAMREGQEPPQEAERAG